MNLLRPALLRAILTVAPLLGSIGPARAADAPPPAPAKEEKLAVTGGALLRTWTPPLYPKAELKARHGGMVTVRLIVDETGKVTQARALEDSDEAFVDAALAAVKAWVFAPAMDEGTPIACCLDTLVAFSPAEGQQQVSATPPSEVKFTPAPRTPPKVTLSPDGEYPSVLVDRKIPGRVRFTCTVTREGRGVNARAVAATHPDFVLPALAGLQQWEFTPAMEGDLVVPGPVEGVVTFDDIDARNAETLAANGLSAPPDGHPLAVTPLPTFVVDPVWPIERLLKGEGGTASVDFTVTETGYVRDVKVSSASQPEFGEALRAAVEMWAFERPVENNQVVTVAMTKTEEFKAIALDAAGETDPLVRLVQKMRRGEIGAAKGLDEKLTPLYRVRPEYPASLKGANAPTGAAEIEFVVDRDGRVRLPRVVSASQAEFGWAAATAVSQWIFKAPHKGGEAVDVKARIPFSFATPVE